MSDDRSTADRNLAPNFIPDDLIDEFGEIAGITVVVRRSLTGIPEHNRLPPVGTDREPDDEAFPVFDPGPVRYLTKQWSVAGRWFSCGLVPWSAGGFQVASSVVVSAPVSNGRRYEGPAHCV